MDIIKAFLAGGTIQPLPIELGTTVFGLPRPTASRIFFNRLRAPFVRKWLWWKLRHIRRENLLKHGQATKQKT